MASTWQLFLTVLTFLSTALAQAEPERIWGSVVFTVPGDASLINTPPILSTTGTQQGLIAGSTIRRRYIDGEANNVTTVHRIERLAKNGTKDVLDHKLLNILSTDDQRIVGTALAFMQGLYPPYKQGNRDVIQWPTISAVTKDDYNFNWVAGANECSNHNVARGHYPSTAAYNTTHLATYDYYQSLSRYLPSLPSAYLAYTNAPTIYSIAEYMYANNATFARQISKADIANLRYLASQHVWDNYGRYSQGSPIPVIGGRMVAGRILGHLTNQISSPSSGAALSLLFGPAETLISFYSISGLAAKEEFHQLPLPGSLLVFEVFSNTEAPLASRLLLDTSKLYVRALLRNGTSESEALKPVPLFYRGTAGSKIPWNDFTKEMTRIAVQSPADWCTQCKSLSIYCAGFLAGSDGGSTGGAKKDCPTTAGGQNCGKVSPTAAGFIGALIATVLFVAAIAVLASCTGGRLAAWRKGRRDSEAEAGSASTAPAGKPGFFTWLKRPSLSKREKRISDADVADSTPDGKVQTKTNSWELRAPATPVVVAVPAVVTAVPASGEAGEISPVSPVSSLSLAAGGGPGVERLRSTKDYNARDRELAKDEEAQAAGVGRAVPRETI